MLQECKLDFVLLFERSGEKAVFTPGKYLSSGPGAARRNLWAVEREIKDLQKIIRGKNCDVVLSPEITGTPSQFGSLAELVQLRKNTNCGITIDFAHLKASNNGVVDYPRLMGALTAKMPFHSHFSGVEYTGKGGRKHLLTEEKDIRKLLLSLLKYDISTTIISESPAPVEDSIKIKKILKQLA